MAIEAKSDALRGRRVKLAHARHTQRAEFDAFFDEWFPRVHGYLAARLGDREACEDATRAVFERAVRSGLDGAPEARASRLLELARSEARVRAPHAFVTRTPRASP